MHAGSQIAASVVLLATILAAWCDVFQAFNDALLSIAVVPGSTELGKIWKILE